MGPMSQAHGVLSPKAVAAGGRLGGRIPLHRRILSARRSLGSGGRRSINQPIRVLIVEDHKLVADALKALINRQPDMYVLATLSSVKESESYSSPPHATVVITDFWLSDGTGADAIRALRNGGCEADAIVLTHDNSTLVQLAAIEVGASGFFHMSQPAAVLIDAIRRVARGESLIGPSTVAAILHDGRRERDRRDQLTAREKEVLWLMAEGIQTREIGSRLGIGYTTVRTYIRALNIKLASHSKVETLVRARELALVH